MCLHFCKVLLLIVSTCKIAVVQVSMVIKISGQLLANLATCRAGAISIWRDLFPSILLAMLQVPASGAALHPAMQRPCCRIDDQLVSELQPAMSLRLSFVIIVQQETMEITVQLLKAAQAFPPKKGSCQAAQEKLVAGCPGQISICPLEAS